MSETLPPSVLNSASSYLPNNFWSWFAVLIFLLALFYTAKVIKGENKQFLQDGHWINWLEFEFFIPAWWTQDLTFTDGLSFYRADTQYQWYFQISKISSHESVNSAKDSFLSHEEIILDLDVVTTTEKNYVLKNENTIAAVEEFLRIESTATEKEVDRIYLDAVWIKFKNKAMIQLISKSSVLNGGIEGPYAEEVIKEIKFKC